jgi:hypothetical protein
VGVPLSLALLGLLVGLPGPDLRGAPILRPASAPVSAAPAALPAVPELPGDSPTPLAGFTDTPSRLEHDRQPGTGEMDEDTLEAIAKLEAKIAKNQASILKKQASMEATQGSLATAGPGSLAKKLKKIKKLMQTLALLASQIEDYQEQIDELEGDGGDPRRSGRRRPDGDGAARGAAPGAGGAARGSDGLRASRRLRDLRHALQAGRRAPGGRPAGPLGPQLHRAGRRARCPSGPTAPCNGR